MMPALLKYPQIMEAAQILDLADVDPSKTCEHFLHVIDFKIRGWGTPAKDRIHIEFYQAESPQAEMNLEPYGETLILIFRPETIDHTTSDESVIQT